MQKSAFGNALGWHFPFLRILWSAADFMEVNKEVLITSFYESSLSKFGEGGGYGTGVDLLLVGFAVQSGAL